MGIVWTDEALDDLAEILTYYHAKAGPQTAATVERRIVGQIEGLAPFPERIRESDRFPGARELVVSHLPYIVFLKRLSENLVVLNIVHTPRKFPT